MSDLNTAARQTAPIWQASAPVAAEGVWLLEASAGTGKTWQLASLVARLVVEEGVAIDRVLVITFTNAATAELRDRVRKRLVEVRELLHRLVHEADAPLDRAPLDEVLRLLIDGVEGQPLTHDDRARRLRRVEAALSAFDLAPISTIHGFCQRMLETLAFESGQDTDLTLVEDTRELRDRHVADALATVFAEVDAATLRSLTSLGWTEKVLTKVADQAFGASAVSVQPDPGEASGPLATVAAYRGRVEALRRWWHDPLGGRALVEALCADGVQKGCGLNGNTYKPEKVRNYATQVGAWLDAGGPGSTLTSTTRGVTKLAPFAAAFTVNGVAAKTSKSAKQRFEHPGLVHFEASVMALVADAPNVLTGFAARAQRALDTELNRRHELTFDAILQRLADAVEGEAAHGESRLAAAIRGLYDVALVDEFQDTDTSQWTVLRHVFLGAPGKRLFLIGDPKQAIYAFRGADVFVYLAAKGRTAWPTGVGSAGRYTMTTNRRSDAGYVRAMNELWGSAEAPFGALDMDYVVVGVPEGTAEARLHGLPALGRPGASAATRARRPLELRWLCGSVQGGGVPRRPSNKGAAELAAAACCAAEVARLLASPAEVEPSVGARRSLRPRDFAVLVNTGREGALVKRALARVGIMAVAAGKGTVFQSEAASWLLQLLDALAFPSHERRARALAVSPLFGWSLLELEASLRDAETPGVATAARSSAGLQPQHDPAEAALWPARLVWERWRDTLTGAAGAWPRRRFAGVVQRLLQDFGVLERLLTFDEGERHATDLRHLIELGHAAERQHHLSPAGLADWLRQHRAAAQGRAAEAESLRLESDAEAVQIVTLHKSKGLQYGVVLIPFAWTARPPKDELGPLVIHPYRDDVEATPERRAQAVLDLHPPKSDERASAMELAQQEFEEEETRKLYVALTRAQHHCVVWFGPVVGGSVDTALNRLLFATEETRALLDGACAKTPASNRRPEDRDAAWAAIDGAAAGLLADCRARFEAGDVGVSVDEEPAVGEQRALRSALRARQRAGDAPAAPGTEPDAQVAAGQSAGAQGRSPFGVATLGARRHLRSSWQRASYTSMASGRGMQTHGDEGGADDARSGGVEAAGSLADDDDGRGLGDLQGGQDDGDAPMAPGRFADLEALARRPEVPATVVTELEATPLPLAHMWGGATVGVWAHAVFEEIDFAANPGVRLAEHVHTGAAIERAREDGSLTELAAAVPLHARPPHAPASALELAEDLGARHGHQRAADHALLVAALPGILTTPLDAPEVSAPWRLAPGSCLAQLSLRDRLDEMSFDLRVAGGEEAITLDASDAADPAVATARIDVDAVTDALARRLVAEPGWDGLGWLQPLVARAQSAERAPAYQNKLQAWQAQPAAVRGSMPRPWAILPRIRGILTGVIDLVFRVPADVPGGYRFYLADYKSNRLNNSGDRVTTAAHYERSWLSWSMGHSAYHLQGLIYTVALHRFLSARVPGYDYDEHVGGHLYLYLRGMEGPAGRSSPSQSARGVYHDRWPREVVLAMSAAIDGPVGAGRQR